MYNPHSSTADNLNFYESCRIFLEKQIVECNDIELKKELIKSYSELIKSVSELEKTVITNNTDWNKTNNTNLTQANMAYNQNAHATHQAHIHAQSQILGQIVQHPQYTPPSNVGYIAPISNSTGW